MSGKHSERLAADEHGLARAVYLLRAGALVALPTETVYGLAARADSEAAVAGIYRAKGRPDFNPLIVHVASLQIARTVGQFDGQAEQLAAAFWPGPLTLVVPLQADAKVVPAITAGLPTIALRLPDHAIMSQVLGQLGVPLAAPSANVSGAVSPTTADHVAASLDGRIDAVVDGGATRRGLESTIVACRGHGWQLLRTGPITLEQVVALLGPPLDDGPVGIEAPGQLQSHYSPGKPVRLNAHTPDADEFMIGFATTPGACNLAEDGNLAVAGARLYACLHAAGESPLPRIAVAPIPAAGIGAAINDRLRRAAS